MTGLTGGLLVLWVNMGDTGVIELGRQAVPYTEVEGSSRDALYRFAPA
jgi:hypothetical protein